MHNDEWKCCICGTKLTEKYHLNGRDYCPDHARDVHRDQFPGLFDEYVRGTIIGNITTRYQFWQGTTKVAECDFECDRQAVEWFKKNYPSEFKAGAEMRAFL